MTAADRQVLAFGPGATNRPPYLQGTHPVEVRLSQSLVREHLLREALVDAIQHVRMHNTEYHHHTLQETIDGWEKLLSSVPSTPGGPK